MMENVKREIKERARLALGHLEAVKSLQRELYGFADEELLDALEILRELPECQPRRGGS